MSVTNLLELLQTSPYLALLAVVGFLARTWVTDRSAFPVTLPTAWQPVVTAIATGALNAVASLQIGAPWQTVVMTSLVWAASTGFLDGVLLAVWGDPKKAPAWARWAVLIFDHVEGGSPPAGGSGIATKPTGTGATVESPVAPALIVPPPPTVHSDESTPTLVEKVPHVPSKPPPPDKPPPAAARAQEGVWYPLAWLAFGVAFAWSACMPPAGLPGTADIAGHYASQSACLNTSDAGDADTWKAAVDACRLADFRSWCAKWPAAEDCAPDAGRAPATNDAGADR